MAGELGDVIGGDTIAAGFTNSVKDRTVMRYANSGERDVLIPAPVEGDMAYLRDLNKLTMFVGAVWILVLNSDDVPPIIKEETGFEITGPSSVAIVAPPGLAQNIFTVGISLNFRYSFTATGWIDGLWAGDTGEVSASLTTNQFRQVSVEMIGVGVSKIPFSVTMLSVQGDDEINFDITRDTTLTTTVHGATLVRTKLGRV